MRLSSVLLLLYASRYVADIHKNDMYPWGTGKFEDRQEDILESFRKNLVLDIKREVIPKNLLNPESKGEEENDIFPLRLKNSEGFDFLVDIENKNQTIPGSVPTTIALSEGISNRRLLSKSLQGLCAFHNKEYWSFEWCHRKEVRQAHIKFVDGKVVRDPDWSLGSYQTTTIEREGDNQRNRSAPIIRVSYDCYIMMIMIYLLLYRLIYTYDIIYSFLFP